MRSRFPDWRRRFEELQGQSNVLAKYPADYLYCGTRERSWPLVKPPSGMYASVAFQQGEVTVYRLTDASDPEARPFAGCGAGAP
jgi:hypothetical protein